MSEVVIKATDGKSTTLHIDSDTPKLLQYVANLEQNGIGVAPTPTVLINDFGGTVVYTYVNVGGYLATLSGAFPYALNYSARFDVAVTQKSAGTDQLSNCQVRADNGSDDSFFIRTSEWRCNQVAPFNTDQFVSDDVLRGQRIFIQQFATEVPTNEEGAFNVVLSKLDRNQIKLWSKIIVRFNGIVTEVDGAKYRRTNDFSLSNKIINS